jgi:hypothetical protein
MARTLTTAVAVCALVAPQATAQGRCNYNGTNGSCAAGANNNTWAISLTITAATRLQLSTSTLALATATADDFMTGFGPPTALGLIMRANTPWSMTVRATAATWTGVGPDARPDRPAGDLQGAGAPEGPYIDVPTAVFTLYSGAPPTANLFLTLYFRARYQWLLDTPGTYTLPLQFTITAP